MLEAELWFTMHHEMTCTPTDFFMRRTGRLFFDINSVHNYKDFILSKFATHYNWSEDTTKFNSEELDIKIKVANSFE